MLTVKHVDQNLGENVFSGVENVRFVPPSPTRKDVPASEYDLGAGAHIYESNGHHTHYPMAIMGDGPNANKIYVMNESGKTVATYSL